MTRSSSGLRWMIGVLACATITVGCTTRIADLTLVSTKNIDLSNAQLDAKTGKRMKGEDCVAIFLVPFGVPNLETAVDRALEAGGGNVMVDQVSYVRQWAFILFGQSCIEVEGTVLTAPTSG